MEEPQLSQHEPGPSSSSSSSSSATTSTDGPSSSSPSTSQVQEEEVVENERQENGDNHHPHHHHRHHHHHHILLNRLQQHHRPSIVSYRMNISMPDAASTEMRDDVWSCLVVLVTFWFFGQFHPDLHFRSLSLSNNVIICLHFCVCFTPVYIWERMGK